MIPTTFAELVRVRVDAFLQTVVMVDDEAFRSAPSPSRPSPAAATFEPAARGRRRALVTPSNVAPEDLDPAKTAKVFAASGLACAILSPQTPQENVGIVDAVLRAAKRADLVVLDWMLNGDRGKTTLDMFERLLFKDRDESKIERRLRVVAIYTGEVNLNAISVKMQRVAQKVYADEKLTADAEGPHFTCGPVRVAVFAKQDAPGHEDDHVTIEQLPDRLSAEFCKLCTGLVAVATITALTGIREDAHRLLTAMGPGLDAAFLGHRVALTDPEDAERHLEELITGEMAAIIGDIEAGSLASAENVDLWLDACLPIAHSPHLVTTANRRKFLRDGLGDEKLSDYLEDLNSNGVKWNKTTLRKVRIAATELFAANADQARVSNYELFERMQFKTLYSKPHPILKLGTVVRFGADSYAFCVQPICDSVRLTSVTSFPFLPARAVPEDSRGDDIYVTRDPVLRDKWITLKLDTGSKGLFLDRFTPSDKQVVMPAIRRAGRRTFLSKGRTSYEWIGELRDDQAQRVAAKLGSSLSRVGLNDPEVLRSGR